MPYASIPNIEVLAGTKLRIYYNIENYYTFSVAFKGTNAYVRAGRIREAKHKLTPKTDFKELWHREQKRIFRKTKTITMHELNLVN